MVSDMLYLKNFYDLIELKQMKTFAVIALDSALLFHHCF